MNKLMQKLNDRLVNGLRRSAIQLCSEWACEYRRLGGGSMPGPWTFNYHPWLIGMHDATDELCVGQKAAQVGYTETMLNRSFFEIDYHKRDVLYILPNLKPDAFDFSSSRFDPALEASPHIASIFSDVKNVGHKRAGAANLFVRGSRTRSALKSIPVALIVMDELEEFTQANIPLAMERTSGQDFKQIWQISTPGVFNMGINKAFLLSTQDHFYFKCPSCSQFIELTFPECVSIAGENAQDPEIQRSFYFCPKCKYQMPKDRDTKAAMLRTGRWESTKTDTSMRGFYINQLYSPFIQPFEIVKSYFRAQINVAEEQEFYNSKLGQAHEVKGSRVRIEDIENCCGEYRSLQHCSGQVVTMGVDVGKLLHYEIVQWSFKNEDPDVNEDAKAKVIKYGTVVNFEDLDRLMRDFQVNACVIDANPERRKALEFARRFHGCVKLCLYTKGLTSRTIRFADDDDHIVQVDRTSWLDQALGRFMRSTIRLPIETDFLYKDQIRAQVKKYDKDQFGNPVANYVNDSDDHYGHARCYSEIALQIAATSGGNHDI